jgi:hypothetical protein
MLESREGVGGSAQKSSAVAEFAYWQGKIPVDGEVMLGSREGVHPGALLLS